MTVIDLTHTIREDMPVYPGTEQPRLTTACTVSQCGYRETLLHMYSHTGTHSMPSRLAISSTCGKPSARNPAAATYVVWRSALVSTANTTRLSAGMHDALSVPCAHNFGLM